MKSMTGFGTAETTHHGERLTVEIKTLNNRFLEFKIRQPRDYSSFETAMIEETKKILKRGYVEIGIQREAEGSSRSSRYHLNFRLAKQYAQILRKLKKDLKIGGALALEELLSLPDLWVPISEKTPVTSHWPIIRRLLIQALRRVE